MTLVKDMNVLQRKVLDACFNGWYMSGEYAAMFDGHRRIFFADSPRLLYKDVEEWFERHAAHHADAPLVVKCTKVA